MAYLKESETREATGSENLRRNAQPLTRFAAFSQESALREQNHPLAPSWNVSFLDVTAQLDEGLLALTRSLKMSSR